MDQDGVQSDLPGRPGAANHGRVFVFAGSAALALLAQLYAGLSVGGLSFSPQSRLPLYLDNLPEESLVRLKLDATSTGRFDIGLFGNSRSVMMGAGELGRAGCSFFNFSIPGSSFRSSVALVEDLAARRAAPHTTVISLDHFELRMMGSVDHLPLTSIAVAAVRDARTESPHVSDVARAVWRQTYAAWTKVKRLLSSDALIAGLGRWLGSDAKNRKLYRADGSRPEQHVAGAPGLHAFTPGTDKRVSERRLAGDLENLNAARSSPGGPERIIIYESPLQPVHARRLAAVPSPDAKRLRELTAATCKRLELECHLGGTPDLDTFSTLVFCHKHLIPRMPRI